MMVSKYIPQGNYNTHTPNTQECKTLNNRVKLHVKDMGLFFSVTAVLLLGGGTVEEINLRGNE